jgi:hypothetical protein
MVRQINVQLLWFVAPASVILSTVGAVAASDWIQVTSHVMVVAVLGVYPRLNFVKGGGVMMITAPATTTTDCILVCCLVTWRV